MADTKQKSKQKPPSRTPKPDTRHTNKKKKKKYRVRNWHDYNEALKQRGPLTVWLDKAALKAEAWYARPSGRRGAQPVYTDLAVTITLQFGKVFRQKLRQTEGLVRSLFALMGIPLKVPTFSTLSRRGGTVKAALPRDEKEHVTIIADSTGLKVSGEGEWKVGKHGYGKHRTWRKFHVAVTPDGEVSAVELTENSVGDNETAPALLAREESTIEAFAGDGAFDTRDIYDLCRERNVSRILIPPQKNAKIWQHGNSLSPPHPRDENLRAIRKTSRERWKAEAGYHIRSPVETFMFRYKTIFGERLDARNMPQQTTETLVKSSILNRMLKPGMPDSYAVAG
jgi:hypothetical protein